MGVICAIMVSELADLSDVLSISNVGSWRLMWQAYIVRATASHYVYIITVRRAPIKEILTSDITVIIIIIIITFIIIIIAVVVAIYCRGLGL